MSIITERLRIFMRADQEEEQGFRLVVIPEKMSYMAETDDIFLEEQEFQLEVNIPDQDALVALAIESFNIKIKEEIEYSNTKIAKLEIKRDQLLQLTHIKEV